MKKLTRLGNSSALVIDKPILELLGIGPETFMEMRTDGINLILTPVEVLEPSDAQVKESAAWVLKRYKETFRLLGDASTSTPRAKSSSSRRK